MKKLPFRFLVLSVLLPNSSWNWLSSSKEMPMSFSSSSTFLISAPSTKASPQLVTRTGGMLISCSSSLDENTLWLFCWPRPPVDSRLLAAVEASSTLPFRASAMSSSSSSKSSSSVGRARAPSANKVNTITTCESKVDELTIKRDAEVCSTPD